MAASGRQSWLWYQGKKFCWKTLTRGGGAIAQWILLCLLPSCRPRFKSRAHHLRFYQFEFKLWHVEKTKISRKRGRDWSILNNFNKGELWWDLMGCKNRKIDKCTLVFRHHLVIYLSTKKYMWRNSFNQAIDFFCSFMFVFENSKKQSWTAFASVLGFSWCWLIQSIGQKIDLS